MTQASQSVPSQRKVLMKRFTLALGWAFIALIIIIATATAVSSVTPTQGVAR